MFQTFRSFINRRSQLLIAPFLFGALMLPLAALAQLINLPNGWSDGYAYANGARIHYYHARPAQGKQVMVMVHGVTDNGLCWTTLAEQFQDDYDIYMLDARGHGLSDPMTSSDDGQTLIKDVVSFVQFMKWEKPILVGHSMGAATVMRVGAEFPDIAKAIILLDPGLGGFPGGRPRGAGRDSAVRNRPPVQPPTNRPPAPDRLSVSMFAAPEVLVAQNNYRFEDLVATGKRQFPKWHSRDIEYWALSKKQYHGPYTPEAGQAMTGTMSTRDALAKIQVPTVILKADASPEVRKANEEAARIIKLGKLIHIDGGGHNLHHDELVKTTGVMKDFLSTL
ncbi:alpha/beta hydrolase [Niabella yanshanensis]|uniref:Alpha/beta hydrolase n=1 Tax=Niabella yanshanensis TaxID=577386 RepID=A0ABZ0W4X6_9BACT|nr:alpha/beta hydrolase [Niabella yanshanensis]WQD38004.1 alpha/beta hydrolase [Niabella yanshanensis]